MHVLTLCSYECLHALCVAATCPALIMFEHLMSQVNCVQHHSNLASKFGKNESMSREQKIKTLCAGAQEGQA